LYHWMDEGFTSFASEIVMQDLRHKGLLQGSNPNARLFRSSYIGYRNLVESGVEEPMGTHADQFKYNAAYGMAAYSKGNLYLQQLMYIIGEDVFWELMLRFYDKCAFKHPTDADFIRLAENISGMQLKWYNQYWIYSTKTIDYAINEVSSMDSSTSLIKLERIGEIPMPIDLLVELKDGTRFLVHIPLDLTFKHRASADEESFLQAETWKWVAPKYNLLLDIPVDQIRKVMIDPEEKIADIVRTNNLWETD